MNFRLTRLKIIISLAVLVAIVLLLTLWAEATYGCYSHGDSTVYRPRIITEPYCSTLSNNLLVGFIIGLPACLLTYIIWSLVQKSQKKKK